MPELRLKEQENSLQNVHWFMHEAFQSCFKNIVRDLQEYTA